MDQKQHWPCVCLSLLLLLGVSSYKTLTEDKVCSSPLFRLHVDSSWGGSTLIQLSSSASQKTCSVIVLPSLDTQLPAHADVLLAVRLVPRGNSSYSRDGLSGTCYLEVRQTNKTILAVPQKYSSWTRGKLSMCEDSTLSKVVLVRDIFQGSTLVNLYLPGHDRVTLRASGVLFNFVYIGPEMCSKPGMVQCHRTKQQCVVPELQCDGLTNCPNDDNDEDKDVCRYSELPDIFASKKMSYRSSRGLFIQYDYVVIMPLSVVLLISMLVACYCCKCNPIRPSPLVRNSRTPNGCNTPLMPQPAAIYIFREGDVPSTSTTATNLHRPTAVYFLKRGETPAAATTPMLSDALLCPTALATSTHPWTPARLGPSSYYAVPSPAPGASLTSHTDPTSSNYPGPSTVPAPPAYDASHTYPTPPTNFAPREPIYTMPPPVSPSHTPPPTYSVRQTCTESDPPPDYNDLFPADDNNRREQTTSSTS